MSNIFCDHAIVSTDHKVIVIAGVRGWRAGGLTSTMAHALHHRHDWRMEEMNIAMPFLLAAAAAVLGALLLMIASSFY